MAPNPLTLVPPREKPTARVPLGGVLAPPLPGVELAAALRAARRRQ